MGRLGFKSVCVVSLAGDQLASDVFGIPHIPLDAANAWHLHLARYLRRAGISVDLNKLA